MPRDVRICFGVEPQLKDRLNKKVEWGDVTPIYRSITEQLVEILEHHDPALIQAGIVSKKISLAKLMDLNKGDNDATD